MKNLFGWQRGFFAVRKNAIRTDGQAKVGWMRGFYPN
jgi:hypothetical protein